MEDYLDEHVEKTLPIIYDYVKDSNMGIVTDSDLRHEIVQGGFSDQEAEELIRRGKIKGLIK
jgi:hypothetical protein